jgi:hypothetical protein
MDVSSAPVPQAGTQNQGRRRHLWLAVLLWAMFGAGLLVQGFAPRLKIKNNAFVIPPSLMSEGKDIRPAEIIALARRMQLLSSVLTFGGAFGLALSYGKVLFGTRSARRDLVGGSQEASTSSRTVE